MKLGSLFDGSGGFPLAGAVHGVVPVWASEIEPYPISVTKLRFPDMKHLGSVVDINGAEIEPVDIVTFGSPCQDLSVAGKQKGIHEGERSNLFFEAIRIVKEMRANDRAAGRSAVDIRPRYLVWENVPGAFSSNKGEDFRAVLEAIIGITEEGLSVPRPPKGKWNHAGCVVGDGWSIAWRVYDAQYWGVPQRRKRIYLVADLASERAGEILFEREGVRGYFEACGAQGQGVATYSQESSAPDGRAGESAGRGMDAVTLEPGIASREGGHIYEGVSGTLRANAGDNQMAVAYPYMLKVHTGVAVDSADKAERKGSLVQEGKAMTLDTTEDQYLFQPVVAGGFCPESSEKTRGIGWGEEMTPTLRAGATPAIMAGLEPVVYPGVGITSPINGSNPQPGDLCHTLNTDNRNFLVAPVYCLQGNGIDRVMTAGCNGKGGREDEYYALNTIDRPAVAYCMGNGQLNQMSMAEQSNTLDCMHDKQAVVIAKEEPPRVHYIVRRLTPTECARLQGFADRWGDIDEKSDFTEEEYRFWLNVRNTHAAINGKQVKEYTKPQMVKWYNDLHTDSAEYKMWGNGIALPCAVDVIGRIARQSRKPEEEMQCTQ